LTCDNHIVDKSKRKFLLRACRCCVLFLSQSVTILDQLVAALPLQDQENAGIQACTMYLLNW